MKLIFAVFFSLLFKSFSVPVNAEILGFVEQEGLLVIEIESIPMVPNGWAEEVEFSGFTGSSYFRYAANNQLNNPGVDLLNYPVLIQNPGLYRFRWRNLIAEGTSTTDANDSWLKIDASAFYGQQGNDSIVCPKGYDVMQNDCPVELDADMNVVPAGSGSAGWFKVYRSGQGEWVWSTQTSDSDAHQIYARFDQPGIYQIQVSGRSKDHAIDRMVAYRDDFSGDPLAINQTESEWADIDLIYIDSFEGL